MLENLATLGRPVNLGGLYSGKGGNFLPGPLLILLLDQSNNWSFLLSFSSLSNYDTVCFPPSHDFPVSLFRSALSQSLCTEFRHIFLSYPPLLTSVPNLLIFYVSFSVIVPSFHDFVELPHQSLSLSGFSFWNEDTVEEHKITKKKLYTNTAIQADNNLLDRISVFKMNSEQKLSFLGGLIDVKGYLRPKLKYTSKARPTMKMVTHDRKRWILIGREGERK